MTWRKVLPMFGMVLTDFSRHNCPYVAAGIAYWTIFSLFPLALAGISILGFLYSTPEEQSRIVEGIVKIVPVSTDYLASLIEDVARARGTLGVLAIIGLLWSGTTVFSAVRKGINHAWHIGQPPYFLLERAIDLVMLLGVAVLAFVVVIFTTNVLGLSTFEGAPDWLSGGLVGKVLLEIVALAVTFGVFLLLYRYVPNTNVEWRDIWLGALVGAVLLHGVRIGFSWFVANFSSFNVVYGSLGTLMAVLVWAYLSSMALMWGAQVAYTYSCAFGSRSGTVDLPGLQPKARKATRRHGFLGVLATVASWLLPPKRTQQ